MDQWESTLAGSARRSATVDTGVAHVVAINGGAAVALLAFLQAVWGKSDDLSALVLLPILVFAAGTGAAGAINFTRYQSSLYSEHCRAQPERLDLMRTQKQWSTWSQRCQWLAVGLFVLGAITVTVGIAMTLPKTPLLFAILAEMLVVIGGAALLCLLLWRLLRAGQ